MSIITFWSTGKEQTGKTLAVAAIATYMAIEHNIRILLVSTGYNDDTLKNCYWLEEKKSRNLGLFGPNTNTELASGIQGLTKIMRSNKISSDIITDYTKIVLKDRLEVLLPYKGSEGEYTEIKKDYDDIIKLANKYYDYVFVDLDKEIGEENEKNILRSSDVVIASISQRLRSLNRYLEEREQNRILKNSVLIPLIGRYDRFSKYTTKNIARYIGNKNELSIIPYNTLFFEACEEANVIDFFLRIRKLTDTEDRNAQFIKEVEKVSNKIMYKVKEIQQRRNI